MRKFKRKPEPPFLTVNWENWGIEWEKRRLENPNTVFHWHVIDGEIVNQKLLPLLKAQTQDHCSFCDAFPVNSASVDTIEHFRPKSEFPREAYKWVNLYYCCTHCQQKGANFDQALLSPDAIDYQFDRYFRWDFTTGELLVNEQAALEDQTRACITITFYKLNINHPKWRKRELRKRWQGENDPLDDFAYRDFVDNTVHA
jgi:uncharacterized protein (TIGR02646 family)